MKYLLTLICALTLLTAGTAGANSWPITYQLSGTLSGSYYMNGAFTPIEFSNTPFSLQVGALAINVRPVTTLFSDDLYVVGEHPYTPGAPALTGILSINNVGSFTFLNKLYAADSQWNNMQPGIFEVGTDMEAAIIAVNNPFFENYQLMTHIAPLPVDFLQVGASQFAVSEIGGSTGDLVLTDASSLMFQAEGGVPEPSTVILLGTGLAGLMVMRFRRKS